MLANHENANIQEINYSVKTEIYSATGLIDAGVFETEGQIKGNTSLPRGK